MIIIKTLSVFVILLLTQIYFDYELNKCPNTFGKMTIILHHIFNIYLVFGSILFGYYEIHIIVIIISFIIHVVFKKCPITIYSNHLCYKESNKNVPLITLLNHLIREYDYKNIKSYYYSLLVTLILFDLYHSKRLLSLLITK